MLQSISQKVKKLRTNLNVKRTLQLVWAAASGWMIFSILMILAETLLFLGSLYALKNLINKISHFSNTSSQSSGDTIFKYVLVAGIFGILYVIAKALSTYLIEVQATKVSNYIDERIHLIAIEMDLSHYESPEYFDILKRAKDAGTDRPNLVITTIVEILKNTLNLCAVASLFITINWFLLPILIVFILPTLFVRIYFANKQNIWRIKHTPLERKSSYLSNLITSEISAKEIRSFSLGNYFKSRYINIRNEVLVQRLKLSYRRTLNELITTAIASIGFFTCVAYIAMGTVHNKTSVGDIVIFLMAFPQAFSLMQFIASGISILYHNNIFINSIFELFDLKREQPDPKDFIPIPPFEALDLELRNVNFTYPHSNSKTLQNINIKIPSGKIIAIVGLNGAGKSTLIKLLSRLYEPSSGILTLGGININEFNIEEYRKQISVVFQDFSKYNVSAEDNIRFGDIHKELNMEEIIIASKKSGSHTYIEQFPNEYKTMMGRLFEDGQEVSIGQWQKLAIARAFYGSARFLVFDEATSALDAIAEKELFDSFRKHIDARAAVIISHRHSAVKHADYIYVLSKGSISQQGTNEELLHQDGDYARLFKEENIEK